MNPLSLRSFAFHAFGIVTGVQPAVDRRRSQCWPAPRSRRSTRSSHGPSSMKRPVGPSRVTGCGFGAGVCADAAGGPRAGGGGGGAEGGGGGGGGGGPRGGGGGGGGGGAAGAGGAGGG